MTETKRCRCGSNHTVLIPNPYEAEINERVVMEWLCGECYQELCWDI